MRRAIIYDGWGSVYAPAADRVALNDCILGIQGRQTDSFEMSATDLTSTRASIALSSSELTSSDARLAELLSTVEALYDQGRYSDALRAAESLGSLERWPSADGRILAGRLALNLGAPRLSRILHSLAARENPLDSRACYFAAIAYWNRYGAFHAWRRYRGFDLPSTASDELRANWFAMKAQLLGALRDFSRAEEWMIAALELVPDSPWLHVELSELLDKQDMPEESLKAAREALALQPYFRPAIQIAAHRLVQCGQDSEALSLLCDAAPRLQSGEVWCQLAALQRELQQYDLASQALTEAERCWPLAGYDSQFTQWFAGQRCDVACLQGRYVEALELAKSIDQPFYQRLVKRLEKTIASGAGTPCNQPACASRVLLPVPFVRQSFNTCAPATLSALSSYWSRPVSHQEIADRICYGGSHASDERRWAEECGWIVREFRITEETIERLIRAGLPLAITVVDPGLAHMQAVVGFDSIRGTFLVQDPSSRHILERSSEELSMRYASSGPKGLLLLPPAELSRLTMDGGQSIDLTDAALYDLQYRLDIALTAGDRATAASTLEQLSTAAPDHRLTWQARLALAVYDGDAQLQLQAIEQLLSQFPKDANLLLMKWSLLVELGNRDERITLLRGAMDSTSDHSIFLSRLAYELFDDSHDHSEAWRCLKRALRTNPHDISALSQFAEQLERHGEPAEALECYRLAACFNETDELQALRYFTSARQLNETDNALGWLRDRCQRLGDRSSHPYRTLACALSDLDRTDDALNILTQAAQRHPQDGELLAHTALEFARTGQLQQCEEYWRAATLHCSAATLAKTRALMSEYQSDPAQSRVYYLEALGHDPLNCQLMQRILQLDSELDGPVRAEERLQTFIQQHPHNSLVQALAIYWSRAHDCTDACADTVTDSTTDTDTVADTVADTFDDQVASIVADSVNDTSCVAETVESMATTADAHAAAEATTEVDTNTVEDPVRHPVQHDDDNPVARVVAQTEALCLATEQLSRQDDVDEHHLMLPGDSADRERGLRIANASSPSDCLRLLRELPADDSWLTVAGSCVAALRDCGQGVDLLESILAEFGPRLQQSTHSWSAVASALMAFGKFRRCVDWTRDWSSRHDAQPSELIPAIVARWELHELSQARPIIAHALTLPNDTRSSWVRLLAGLDALLSDDLVQCQATAQVHARAIDQAELSGWYRAAYRVLMTTLDNWPKSTHTQLQMHARAHATAERHQGSAAVNALLTQRCSQDEAEWNYRLTHWLRIRAAAKLARACRLKWTSYGLLLRAAALRWLH